MLEEGNIIRFNPFVLRIETYPNEGSDYENWGKMKPEIFSELIECFKNSKSVKWKYRKQL